MNKIEQKQKKAIVNAYIYRLKTLNIDVNNADLEQKILLLPSDELNKFFFDIMKTSNDSIAKIFNKLNIQAHDNGNQLQNNIIIELETNQEIINIIEEGISSNISNETIVNKVETAINIKYPKYKNISNLKDIIINLIEKKSSNNKKSQNNSFGGRQYVLSTNPSRSFEEDVA